MILIRHHNEGNLKPYFYWALEEYVLKHLLKEEETYFFTWEIHGVVVGKNQVIENEVNLDYLRANNIQVFRRPTGGGCVYADHRNTMFTIVTKRLKNQQFSFKTHLVKIVESMKLLGIDLEFSGRNDILYKGKKVSGNAFLQNKYGVLIHGTFLYDCDLETMVRAITPNDEKLISKGVESVRSRVVNLKPYLPGISQNEIIKHWEETLTDTVYELNPLDIEQINKLALTYQSAVWTFQKQPAYTKVMRRRIDGGTFEIQLSLKEGIIEKLDLHGDFFDLKPLTALTQAFEQTPYTKVSIESVLQNHPIESYILDAKKESFLALLSSGILEQ